MAHFNCRTQCVTLSNINLSKLKSNEKDDLCWHVIVSISVTHFLFSANTRSHSVLSRYSSATSSESVGILVAVVSSGSGRSKGFGDSELITATVASISSPSLIRQFRNSCKSGPRRRWQPFMHKSHKRAACALKKHTNCKNSSSHQLEPKEEHLDSPSLTNFFG